MERKKLVNVARGVKDTVAKEHKKLVNVARGVKDTVAKEHKKLVTVARGVKETRAKKDELKKKPGSSNEGKYKTVSKGDFAGKSGGSSPHSFPINTKTRARNALSRAHFAPDPEGIRKAVHRKYPDLGKRKK